jgi:hypothetical protein
MNGTELLTAQAQTHQLKNGGIAIEYSNSLHIDAENSLSERFTEPRVRAFSIQLRRWPADRKTQVSA